MAGKFKTDSLLIDNQYMPFVTEGEKTISGFFKTLFNFLDYVSGNTPVQGVMSNVLGSSSSSSSSSSPTGDSARFYLDTYNNTNTFGSSIRGRRFRGSPYFESGILKDDILLQIVGDGYVSGSGMLSSIASIAIIAAEDYVSGLNKNYAGNYIILRTTPTGTTQSVIRIKIEADGKIGIDNTFPQYNLDVSGSGNFTRGVYLDGVSVANINQLTKISVTGLDYQSGNLIISGLDGYVPIISGNRILFSGGGAGTSGFSGYSGTVGSTGPSGATGISGFSGFSGFSGYSGSVGPSGVTGVSGFSGFSGISGWSGFSGFSGTNATISSYISGISITGSNSLTGLVKFSGLGIIGVTLNDNNIYISGSAAAGAGEANTASNLGVGSGLFSQKVGVDLQFKSIVPGDGINISGNSNQLILSTPQWWFQFSQGAITYTNMPALQSFFNSSSAYITKINLTPFTGCNLVVNKAGTAGVANSFLYLGYRNTFSTTVGDYTHLVDSRPKTSVDSTNVMVDSGWFPITNAAKTTTFLTLLGSGGNGTVDPIFGAITAYFK